MVRATPSKPRDVEHAPARRAATRERREYNYDIRNQQRVRSRVI